LTTESKVTFASVVSTNDITSTTGFIFDKNGQVNPAGCIVMFGGTTAPTGWLLCDGSTVSRTTYAVLHSVIGSNYGSGNGSTTFHLPDMRGRFARGRDGGATGSGRDPNRTTRIASNTGGNTGDAVGSLQIDAFQSHTHNLRAANAYTFFPGLAKVGNTDAATDVIWPTVSSPIDDGVGGTSRCSTETRPVNVYVNYIIKF
jgi:microcystin-dependent protein